MQKVLLFAPSPSRHTLTDLVLPKAGEKGKLPGERLRFSLLAAGHSLYVVGEGRTLLNYLQLFWGSCGESGWMAAKSGGDPQLCAASRWRRLFHPAPAVSSPASANESPMANTRCLGATQTGCLPPPRTSMAISNSTSYLKLPC